LCCHFRMILGICRMSRFNKFLLAC
jgi:hypothetical protein